MLLGVFWREIVKAGPVKAWAVYPRAEVNQKLQDVTLVVLYVFIRIDILNIFV